MPFSFPTHVIVTINKEDTFSCPPKDFREKMMVQINDFFGRKLEPEFWGDLEAALWWSVQRLPIFKSQRMMVKLKSMTENREKGLFDFRVFLTKRPEVWPRWSLMDPVSDDDEAPSDIFYAMKVSVKLLRMDSLKKSSGLLVGNMNPDELLVEGRPLPDSLLSYVKAFANKDMCD